MEQNYYLVEAMCGHVGKRRYIPIKFAIIAENGKEAAKIARNIPRVKHDNKYAILQVEKVNYDTFQNQVNKNKEDQYLNWRDCRYCETFNQEDIQERIISYVGKNRKKEKEKRYDRRKEQRREEMYIKLRIQEAIYECAA